MKYFILSVLLFVLLNATESQDISVAPVNKEFLDFMDGYNNVKSIIQETHATGIAPSPFTYNFLNDTTIKQYNAQEIPSIYDLRNIEDGAYLTAVKDQGTSGTCWAFATYGSFESYILQQYALYYDFSEQNLATCHGFEWEPDFGGNFSMPVAYFSRHAGPISEADDSYSEPTNNDDCINNLVPPLYIEKALFLPGLHNTAYNINQIKQAIMDYGALAINMYYNSLYYNPQDYTYYYNDNELTNHAVILIGWDDNKTVTGGSDSPTSTGAWIARNSWGEEWGEDGFFYISYEDNKALKSIVFFPSLVNFTSNSLVYLYDESGMTGSYGFGTNDGYGLVKYIPGNDEILKRIGTYATSDFTILNIEVYDNFDGKNLSNLMASKYNVTCEHSGYYTIELDDDISLNHNDDYYIKVYYHTPNHIFPLPREFRIITYNGDTPIEEPGNCWTSYNGNTWTSLGMGTNHEWDLCIKAYTTIESIPSSIENEDMALSTCYFYPNPTNGILNFNTFIKQLKIYNITGSCLMTLNNPELTIDLSYLPEGYYIIVYKTMDQHVYKSKITIVH